LAGSDKKAGRVDKQEHGSKRSLLRQQQDYTKLQEVRDVKALAELLVSGGAKINSTVQQSLPRSMATFSTVAKASTKQASPRPTVTISTAANSSIKRSLPRPVAIVSTIAEAKLPSALSLARYSEDGSTRRKYVTEYDETHQEGTVASDISSTSTKGVSQADEDQPSRLLQGTLITRPMAVSTFKGRTISTCSNPVPELQPQSNG
jgi:hypothetical protein